MEFKYDINKLTEISGISKQSAYAFIKKNNEFVSQNSIRQHRQVLYNQAVYDLFVAYYKGETAGNESVDESSEATQAEPVDEDRVGKSKELVELKLELERLKAENATLHETVQRLTEEKNKIDAERTELMRQNGIALLALQQAQQETMRLLPAPKKSLFDRLSERRKNIKREKGDL